MLESTRIALEEDCRSVCSRFGFVKEYEIFSFEVAQGVALPAARISFFPDLEITAITTSHYPGFCPHFLVRHGGETKQLQPPWSLEVPLEERLITALESILARPGPYRRQFGLQHGVPLTDDPQIAELAGWKEFYTGLDPATESARVRDGLFARSTGLLSRDLETKRVLIAGLGSVGSYMAEQLVRSGLGALTLVDMDEVEPSNLSRTAYDLGDVGVQKSRALAGRLLNINPSLKLDLRSVNVLDIEKGDFDTVVRSADLVLAATDDLEAQRRLNHFAYARGKPAVFVGLFRGAQGGEVVFSVPDRTPCYHCATNVRHQIESAEGPVSRETDYGTGRLQGEVALSADIHHITSAAMKVSLALMVPEASELRLGSFLASALADGTSFLTLSTVECYWFFPHVFGDVPGQRAYQAVWLTPESNPTCPVCGDPEAREDPLSFASRAPDLESIRKGLSASQHLSREAEV